MDNMIIMLNVIGDIVIFYAIIKVFQVSADVKKLTRLIENRREDTRDTKEIHERFIIDEEHDIVIDTKTNTKMNIFEYNNLILASTDETDDIEE